MIKDQIIKCLAYDGKIQVVCASTTQLVEKARQVHDFSPTVTAAFGRVLTMTAIMGAEMKNEKDRLTLQIKGNGPMGMMVAVANSAPRIKGYVTDPRVELPLNEDGKLDVAGAIGTQGFMNVIKDIGLKEPYIGISPIVSGEIAEDFAHYYETSQQQPSAVALGVLVNTKGVQASGGYLITPMPDAKQEDILSIEKAIFQAGAISRMLDQNLSLLEIAKKVSGDKNLNVLEDQIVPTYHCDCSKEHMADGIASLGKQEIQRIIEEDGKAEVTCHFCNSHYQFTKEELEMIKQYGIEENTQED